MWWMWNDQTGATNRFLMRRADWSSMSPACSLLCARGSKTCYSSTGPLDIWSNFRRRFPAVYRLYMYIYGRNVSQHGVCHIFF